MFSQAAVASGKIVCNIWAPGWLDGRMASFETESDPHLALFHHSMDRCFAMICRVAIGREDAARRGPARRREDCKVKRGRSIVADMLAATSGTSLNGARSQGSHAKLYGNPYGYGDAWLGLLPPRATLR